MRFPMVLAGFLILVMTGLCLGQAAANMPPGTKAQTLKTALTPAAWKDKIAAMPLIKDPDGLQCLMTHRIAMAAAYAEAANSGCTRAKVGQATLYTCGYSNSAEAAKCNAAKAKIDALIKNCGLKPPVFQDPSTNDPDGSATAGCNSLGITCSVMPG